MPGAVSPHHQAVAHPHDAVSTRIRVDAARIVGVAAMGAYNWWVIVPFRPGLLTSTNGFFSDLSATGQPGAAMLQRLDVTAGVLLLAALLVHPPTEREGRRTEWLALLVFAVAGLIGARYHYVCAEGLSASCRSSEVHLQLPARHYAHVVAGIVEFAAITIAVTQALRRTDRDGTLVAALYRGVTRVLIVGYPLLAVCYLSDRWGVFIEPVFFLAFTTTVLGELFEPIAAGDRRPPGGGSPRKL